MYRLEPQNHPYTYQTPCGKGAITYEKQSRVFVYTPLIQERDYLKQESDSFLNRYFNGNISAMVSAYLEDDELSKSDIEELRTLLSRKGGE